MQVLPFSVLIDTYFLFAKGSTCFGRNSIQKKEVTDSYIGDV